MIILTPLGVLIQPDDKSIRWPLLVGAWCSMDEGVISERKIVRIRVSGMHWLELLKHLGTPSDNP